MKATPETKGQVLELFYRTELRWNEEIIDNRSETISKDLGISPEMVNYFINMDMKTKVLKIGNNIRNGDRQEDLQDINDIDVQYQTVKPAIQYPITPKTKNKKGQYTKNPIYFSP